MSFQIHCPPPPTKKLFTPTPKNLSNLNLIKALDLITSLYDNKVKDAAEMKSAKGRLWETNGQRTPLSSTKR